MTPNQSDAGSRTEAHDTIITALKTRRRFLAGTAAIGATVLAGCSGSDSDTDGMDGGDQSTTTEADDMDGGSQSTTTDADDMDDGGQSNPDVDVLNYALTLEHLEHQFYKQGLNAFDMNQLRNAASGVGDEIRSRIPGRLDTIRAHEKGHVDAITGVVEDLGGEPAARPSTISRSTIQRSSSRPHGCLSTSASPPTLARPRP